MQVSAADMLRHKVSFKRALSQRQSVQRPLERSEKSKGMVLPFRPLNMAFSHMYYSVDLPSVSAPLLLLRARYPSFWCLLNQSNHAAATHLGQASPEVTCSLMHFTPCT